ncbi:DDE_3 domain-containing protein [Trichonephila clavipes]|nr:DDE_3 domain-containing protein [Trichonephila clavipes]
MNENAHLHRVNIVNECLKPEDIIRMKWQAFLPDLNLPEHVWDMLSQRVAAHQSHSYMFTGSSESIAFLEWSNFPQDQIDSQRAKTLCGLYFIVWETYYKLTIIPSM